MKLFRIIAVALLAVARPAFAEDSPAEKLKEIEAQIVKTPDDPMLFYRKARCLMTLEKREEGYQAAKEAMALFIKKGDDLAWMLLEQIDLGHIRVDVHFNMGSRERHPPEMGIIRPLSFRIWEKGEGEDEDGDLLRIIDFEFGMFDGKPTTAALGQSTGMMHSNFGMLDTDSTYGQIRKRLIELTKKLHPGPDKQPSEAPPAKKTE
ncbi:MAG: tetratricopeptide repeat protein [Kiritimatiellia bacterium]|jgi:hypothetical protein